MVPSLAQPQSTGVGKLLGNVGFRLPSGNEVGGQITDLQLVHELTDADMPAVEAFIPGAVEAHRRGFGETSDGRRPLHWVPKDYAVRLELSRRSDGTLLYAGPATVRKAVLRVVPRACVLTVSVRLEALDPDDAPELLRAMGQLVGYDLLVMQRTAAARAVDRRQGELPLGGELVECAAGDLVAYRDDAGVVVSVAGGRVVVRPALVDGPDVVPVDLAEAEVTAAVRVCGPRGGDAADALARLAARAPVRPLDLLLALMSAQASGSTELLDAGWALTPAVCDAAVALVDPAAPPDPGGDDEELPPEPLGEQDPESDGFLAAAGDA